MINYSGFTEEQARDVVAAGVFDHADHFELVTQGAFLQGGVGLFPAVHVICHHAEDTRQGESYSVHTAVIRLTADLVVDGVRLIDGEYGLDLDAAKAALDER